MLKNLAALVTLAVVGYIAWWLFVRDAGPLPLYFGSQPPHAAPGGQTRAR